METDFDQRVYPLLGSIQNSVGMGFLGNEAVNAIANRLRVRVCAVPSSFASARGGMDGRMMFNVDPKEFRRGVQFLVRQEPGVLVIGYLPKPEYVEIVATAIRDYVGLVVLDPVLGDYEKGLYVSVETARSIRDMLVPRAQVVTPNRFEAEVLLDLARDRAATERTFLDTFAALGPQTVIITSFTRDRERRSLTTLFSNGYQYEKLTIPLSQAHVAYGAGDVFAGAMASFLSLGTSPFTSSLMATAVASAAVARASQYGGASVDPVAALDAVRPMGYLEEDKARLYCQKFGIVVAPISATEEQGNRLRFAPPKNRITS